MEKPILVKFGDRVREIRLQKGLSQEALAEKASLHRTYIGMIERAEKNIILLNIEKVVTSIANCFYTTDTNTGDYIWNPNRDGIDFLNKLDKNDDLEANNPNSLKNFIFRQSSPLFLSHQLVLPLFLNGQYF